MRKSLLVVVLLPAAMCLASMPSNAQRLAPKVGEAAPGLSLNKILQAGEAGAVDLKALRGNVVVLEFWATWCRPCIPSIRHFNELSERFRGKPVRFIAITDEDEPKVAEFVKAQPIRTWIGLDNSRATFDAYQAVGLPHTVVVDRAGRVAAITSPESVTEAVLNDLLADRPVSLPLKGTTAADLEWDAKDAPDGLSPLTQVIIKPSNATTGGQNSRPGHFTADGAPLLALVIAAYQTSPHRVVSSLPESSKTYKVSVVVPPGREETLYTLFQSALATTFGINVRREMREADVLVLSIPRGKAFGSPPSQAGEKLKMVMRGEIRSKRQHMAILAEQLEMVLGRPVIDKTGLPGEYDWELPYSGVDKNVLLNAVRERLGLELTETRQAIEMLVVEPQGPGR